MKNGYAKYRADHNKELGICVACGRRDAAKGRIRCPDCLAKERKRANDRRLALIDQGMCVSCAKAKAGVNNRCAVCRGRLAAWKRRRNFLKKLMGRCIQCGRRKPFERSQWNLCPACAEKREVARTRCQNRKLSSS